MGDGDGEDLAQSRMRWRLEGAGLAGWDGVGILGGQLVMASMAPAVQEAGWQRKQRKLAGIQAEPGWPRQRSDCIPHQPGQH